MTDEPSERQTASLTTSPSADAAVGSIEDAITHQAVRDLEEHLTPMRAAIERATGRTDLVPESTLEQLRQLRREPRGVTMHPFSQGVFRSPEGIPYVARLVQPSHWSPYWSVHVRLGICCGVEVVTPGVTAADLVTFTQYQTGDGAPLPTQLHRCALDPRVTRLTRWVRSLQR